MPNAHFIIFDTNNEYERAFTKSDGTPLYNRLVIRNDGDKPSGLWIPHWFMNSPDYQAFFRPGEGAQAPLLFTAISAARAAGDAGAAKLQILSTISDTINQIDAFLKLPPTMSGAAYFRKKNLREQYLTPLLNLLAAKQSVFYGAGFIDSWNLYLESCTAMLNSVQGDGDIDAVANDTIREQLQRMEARLVEDRDIRGDAGSQIGVDSPIHFDFDEFVTRIFADVLIREAEKNPALRNERLTLEHQQSANRSLQSRSPHAALRQNAPGRYHGRRYQPVPSLKEERRRQPAHNQPRSRYPASDSAEGTALGEYPA